MWPPPPAGGGIWAPRGGGSINNTATILTPRATTVPMSINAAAKGGVAGLAAALAFEGGPHGIRVNTLSPGLIETPPTAPFIKDPTNPLQVQVRSSPWAVSASPRTWRVSRCSSPPTTHGM
nr:SDR family oxidoreductase [Nocardia farcinica]